MNQPNDDVEQPTIPYPEEENPTKELLTYHVYPYYGRPCSVVKAHNVLFYNDMVIFTIDSKVVASFFRPHSIELK